MLSQFSSIVLLPFVYWMKKLNSIIENMSSIKQLLLLDVTELLTLGIIYRAV